jgi:hypothetical protein
LQSFVALCAELGVTKPTLSAPRDQRRRPGVHQQGARAEVGRNTAANAQTLGKYGGDDREGSMSKIILFAAAAALLIVSPGHAQIIGTQTKCSIATLLMLGQDYGSFGSQEKLDELFLYIATTMWTIDYTFGKLGQGEITAQMTPRERENLIKAVTLRCRLNSNDTVFQTIFKIYDEARIIRSLPGFKH